MKEYTPAPPQVGTPEIESPNAPPRVPPSHAAPPSKGRWVWFLLLALIAGAAYYMWTRASGAGADASGGSTASKGGSTGKGGKGGKGSGNIPIVAVKAIRSNIGDYITALGNVTPIYTVTLKTVVDGQLMNVFYKEGDLVQKGAPLVEIDRRPFEVQLEQAEGALVRDQAQLDNAKVDLDRYDKLLKQNAIPEQQYATQVALVKQDEGLVKADQGQIDSAKLNITYSHINAPITGRVGLRLVDPGNIVHATDANGLLVITQVQPISVIFPIAEDQLPNVFPKFRAGQKLSVEAWDRDQTHKLDSGVLSTLDNQIDQSTGTVRLRADFPNPNETLFANQFVFVRLLVQEKTGVTLIPTAAIQRTTTSTYVYLVNPDSSVSVRNLTLGISEGDESQVLAGLSPGDEVVMTGVDKLNEGTKVTAQLQSWAPHTGPVANNPGMVTGADTSSGSTSAPGTNAQGARGGKSGKKGSQASGSGGKPQ